MAKIEGNGKPNNYTVGQVGDRYIDLNTTFEYVCDLAYDSTAPGDDPYYIWRLLEQEISSGGGQPLEILLQDKTFTENGSYSADEGYDGLGTVAVRIPLYDGSYECDGNATGVNELIALLDGSITELNSNAETVSVYASYYNDKLVSINLPKVITIAQYAFAYCTALRTVNLPLLDSTGNRVFYKCGKLTTVYLPNVTSLAIQAFQECVNLVSIDLPKVTYLSRGVFQTCRALRSLIIRTEIVCEASDTSLLADTLIAGGTGYIYVPRELVENYKVATNWCDFASQFRALEDYTVDGTVNGALDESKI